MRTETEGGQIMKKVYMPIFTLYLNQKVIGFFRANLRVLEKPMTEYIDITWNNFYDTFKTYPLSEIITFTICRKGFKIWSFHNSKIKIKQWKVPELNMQLEIEYKEMKPTIQELLRYITIDELNDLINQ